MCIKPRWLDAVSSFIACFYSLARSCIHDLFPSFLFFCLFLLPPECGTVNACKEGCGSSETQSRLVSITAVNPAVSFLTSPCFPPPMPTAHLSDASQNSLLFDSITAHCLFTSSFKAVIPNCFCPEAHKGSSTSSMTPNQKHAPFHYIYIFIYFSVKI